MWKRERAQPKRELVWLRVCVSATIYRSFFGRALPKTRSQKRRTLTVPLRDDTVSERGADVSINGRSPGEDTAPHRLPPRGTRYALEEIESGDYLLYLAERF